MFGASTPEIATDASRWVFASCSSCVNIREFKFLWVGGEETRTTHDLNFYHKEEYQRVGDENSKMFRLGKI